jgi:hypothetical protein
VGDKDAGDRDEETAGGGVEAVAVGAGHRE